MTVVLSLLHDKQRLIVESTSAERCDEDLELARCSVRSGDSWFVRIRSLAVVDLCDELDLDVPVTPVADAEELRRLDTKRRVRVVKGDTSG